MQRLGEWPIAPSIFCSLPARSSPLTFRLLVLGLSYIQYKSRFNKSLPLDILGECNILP